MHLQDTDFQVEEHLVQMYQVLHEQMVNLVHWRLKISQPAEMLYNIHGIFWTGIQQQSYWVLSTVAEIVVEFYHNPFFLKKAPQMNSEKNDIYTIGNFWHKRKKS